MAFHIQVENLHILFCSAHQSLVSLSTFLFAQFSVALDISHLIVAFHLIRIGPTLSSPLAYCSIDHYDRFRVALTSS